MKFLRLCFSFILFFSLEFNHEHAILSIPIIVLKSQILEYHINENMCYSINVREYRRGNQK